MAADRRLVTNDRTTSVGDEGIGVVRRNEPLGREASLGGLVRDLVNEGVDLMRQEVNLAKLELRETTSALTKDAVKLGIAAGVAAAGALSLVACLIMVVGELLDGAYWAGALIVGAIFLLVGLVMARSASSDMKKHDLKPNETIRTLREDQQWAKGEAREFKRQVM